MIFIKNDFLVEVAVEMNGVDCKKYLCEYILVIK